VLNTEQLVVFVYINIIKRLIHLGIIEEDVTNLRHTKKPDFIFEMRVERNWIAGYTDCDLPLQAAIGR
jgi:hypothetical protein